MVEGLLIVCITGDLEFKSSGKYLFVFKEFTAHYFVSVGSFCLNFRSN